MTTGITYKTSHLQEKDITGSDVLGAT